MEVITYLKDHFKEGKSLWFLRLCAALYFNPSKATHFYYRMAHYYWQKKKYWTAKFFFLRNVKKHGCYISEKCYIGKNIHFKHPNGIVIGEDVAIEDDVTIYHQVTIGGKNIGDKEKQNYPTIKSGVTVFAGAKILGNYTVGSGATIGANSVVIADVEKNSVYAGIPAKKIH